MCKEKKRSHSKTAQAKPQGDSEVTRYHPEAIIIKAKLIQR